MGHIKQLLTANDLMYASVAQFMKKSAPTCDDCTS